MGSTVASNAFPQFNQLLNTSARPDLRVSGRGPSAHAALPALSGGPGKAADTVSAAESAPLLTGEFEALTYSAQMQRVSLVAEFQKVRERVAAAYEDAGQVPAEAGMEQLTFSFFAESRLEELALFQQRTANVAEGLEGARKQSFVQASRQMSARFSMSLTISGAALNGFAGAAEGLQDGEPAAFDQFLGFAQDLLSKMDEIANEVFSLMHDLVQGSGDLQERLDKFIQELRALGLFGDGEAPALTGESGPAGQAQFRAGSFSVQLEFELEYAEVVQVRQGAVQEADPIVLDLDGDGIELSSYRQGARFDITGTGKMATTAFVTGGDAFLAIDRNSNGRIDNGTELFGDQNGAANGFEELRKLDSNGDGRINRLDEGFNSLLLWRDDGDGQTEDGELISLADGGINEISLGYRNVNQVAAGGNRLAQIASFVREDGSRGAAADAILNFTA